MRYGPELLWCVVHSMKFVVTRAVDICMEGSHSRRGYRGNVWLMAEELVIIQKDLHRERAIEELSPEFHVIFAVYTALSNLRKPAKAKTIGILALDL
jgi:hypothetical protein